MVGYTGQGSMSVTDNAEVNTEGSSTIGYQNDTDNSVLVSTGGRWNISNTSLFTLGL